MFVKLTYNGGYVGGIALRFHLDRAVAAIPHPTGHAAFFCAVTGFIPESDALHGSVKNIVYSRFLNLFQAFSVNISVSATNKNRIFVYFTQRIVD